MGAKEGDTAFPPRPPRTPKDEKDQRPRSRRQRQVRDWNDLDLDWALVAAPAATAISVPAMPFELGRWSVTNVCPRPSASRGRISRTAVSDGPPGGTGTMMRTGRPNPCAAAATGNAITRAAATRQILRALRA